MASVNFRLPDAMKYELEDRAGSQSISRYMIELMERDWHRADQYEAIQAALDDLRAVQRRAMDVDGAPLGLQVELLLLLRALAGPDAQRRAQAEVDRLGLAVWSSDNPR